MLSRRLCTWVVGGTLVLGSMVALAAKDGLNIRLRDDCDRATFNAALFDGACVGGGDTTFEEFFAEFLQTGRVEKWRFNNDRADVKGGTAITLTNRGGETHTFTRVAQFAGGVVPDLNVVPGDPDHPLTTAPECFGAVDNIEVPAGTTIVEGPTVAKGEHAKFQCCIHPWMHAEITGK